MLSQQSKEHMSTYTCKTYFAIHWPR